MSTKKSIKNIKWFDDQKVEEWLNSKAWPESKKSSVREAFKLGVEYGYQMGVSCSLSE